ncbi:MAG: DUF4147 domain-containing protein [Candidatus Heimdallarchaeota archaeon]|nr:DUF4147 domain-containing protein [Candidatus Heimdallarchaeota archaeon]MCK4954181.1 DUF4147 domain-containing protein [Candidatus Heimdallarchaeota archaeon]
MKNKSDLLNLARNDDESRILNEMIDSMEFVLKTAQPNEFLSSSVLITDELFEIHEKSFDFSSYDRFCLLSFGKASQTMTEWVLEHFPVSFSRIIIVSPEECNENLSSRKNLISFKAGHPIPNLQSVKAAETALSVLSELSPEDLCIVLISGGGSSLLDAPDNDLPFSDYVELIENLLLTGASIHEINTLRKHYSSVKGGKLAINSKASFVSLIISDVIGNDPSFVASGPTVPDITTWKDCNEIIKKYNMENIISEAAFTILENGLQEKLPDTPSDASLFSHIHNFVIGNNILVLDNLKKRLSDNYCVKLLDYKIYGEAKVKGKELASIASSILNEKKISNSSPFCFLLFGGETTVKIDDFSGLGGRNQELALSFALSNKAKLPIYLVSFGTDGIDGNSQAAGAIVGPFTIKSENHKQIAIQALSSHDSNSFFKENGGEIITGYTGTNIMDISIICVKTNL